MKTRIINAEKEAKHDLLIIANCYKNIQDNRYKIAVKKKNIYFLNTRMLDHINIKY